MQLPSLFGRVTSVFEEHRTLHKTVAHLHDSCARLAWGTRDDARLLRTVEQFESQLRQHFASEEQDGYFGTLESSSPSGKAIVDSLRAEHTVMLARIGDIQALLRRSSTCSSELAGELQRLIEQYERHERKESAAMAEFLAGPTA